MPNPPTWFREALGSLPPDALAAFVADVWRARGRPVRRDGLMLHVEGGPTGERVLSVVGSDGSVPDGVDAVVVTDPETDRNGADGVIGPDELFEQVRYALPAAESEQLIRDHLGVEPEFIDTAPPTETGEGHETVTDTEAAEDQAATTATQDTPAESEETEPVAPTDDGAAPTERSRPSRRSVLVGAGGFVAGLGAAAAGWLGPFGPAGGSTDTGNASGTTQTPTPAPVVAVPGLSQDGVNDSAVLAEAHLTRLDAASYTVTTTQTVHRSNGNLLASLGLTTRVTEDRRMHVKLATAGRASPAVFGEPPIQATLYSDGEQQFRRFISDEGTDYDVVALGAEVNGWFYWSNIFPWGSLFISAIEYIQDLFGAVPVSLESRAGDGEPPYTLHATGVRVDPHPQVFDDLASDSPARNLDLLASVTGAGLVSSLGLEFAGRRVTDRVTVNVSYDYHNVGGTTVEPPEWLGEASPGTPSG